MASGKGSVIQGSFLTGLPRPALDRAPSFTAASHLPRPPLQAAPQRPAIQRAAHGSAVPWAASPGFFAAGAGQRLPETVQRKMESLFGARFDDVRIHVGPQASSIGALAFTHGSDVYFAPGQYDPQTPRGHRLLGHELTHVVQQRTGRARNPFGSGVAVLQDPGLEAEAERMGLRAATPQASSGPAAAQRHPAVSLPRPRPALQLKAHPLARGVIQRVRENDLQALSMLFTGYQRSGDRSAAGEIQAMYIDSNVVVTANSNADIQKARELLTSGSAATIAARIGTMHGEAGDDLPVDGGSRAHRRNAHNYDFLYADGSTKGGVARAQAVAGFINTHLYQGDDRLLPTLTSSRSAASAEACADLLAGSNQIIFLRSDGILHAEQQLLRVLAYRLRVRSIPAYLGLRGVRKPCTKCHAVLSAFARAYSHVYGRMLDHPGVGEGTEAEQLDLKGEFAAADDDFGTFLKIYDELLKPGSYHFNLSNTHSVAAAATLLESHLSRDGLARAKALLLMGYEANRPGQFEVSRYNEAIQPISFTGAPGMAKSRYLSDLLTRLRIAHEPPAPVIEAPVESISSRPRATTGNQGPSRRRSPGERRASEPPLRETAPRENVGPRRGAGQNQGPPWGWIGGVAATAVVAAWYNWPTIASWLAMKEDPASQQPRSIPPPPIRWR